MTLPDKTICAGINCPKHGDCQRYQGFENKSRDGLTLIGRCGDSFLSFIPIQPVKEKQ